MQQQQPQQHSQGPPPLPHSSQPQSSAPSPYPSSSNSSAQHSLPPSSSSSSSSSQLLGGPAGLPSSSSPSTISSSSSTSSSVRPQPNKEQLVALFRERLVASGEKARLKALLNSRLAEVQWKKAVVHHCEGVMQKAGVEKATVDLLHQQTIHMARDTVPQHIKQEMFEVRSSYTHTADTATLLAPAVA